MSDAEDRREMAERIHHLEKEITHLQEQLRWRRFPDEEPDDDVFIVIKSAQASWLARAPTHLTELDEWFVVPTRERE